MFMKIFWNFDRFINLKVEISYYVFQIDEKLIVSYLEREI